MGRAHRPGRLRPHLDPARGAFAADHGGHRPGRHAGADLHPPTRLLARDEIARSPVGAGCSGEKSREEIYRWLATEAALDLTPAACWLLLRIDDHEDRTAAQLADHLHVPEAAVVPASGDELDRLGLVERRRRRDRRRPTPVRAGHGAGRAALDRLAAARRKGLAELLGGWSPDEHEEVVQMVARLASDLMSHALADPAMVASPGDQA